MPLVQLRAGRCERRGNTNWVDPQPNKGLVALEQSNEDGLLHFQYRDLESNTLIDDLILFPGDATFTKCTSAGGGDAARVYVLKFTSSSARHFYWMQDVSTENDDRLARRVNALIDDPDAPDTGDDASMQTDQSSLAPAEPATQSQSSTTQQESSSSSSYSNQQTNQRSAQALPSGVTSDQMAQLQAILAQSASSGGAGSSSMMAGNSMMPSVSLADILSPARLTAMLDANPSLAESLYPYLPSDTNVVPHNLETLKRVVTSPELRKSARSLDQALTTGALGPLAASLGMSEEETFGVENYLRGVQRLGDEEKKKAGTSDETMDT